ncbi:MAG: sugar phosphate isomerase/epimerase [Actinomycetota bacterium]|nr:MAG: sugar phosphate isomerase/epimerase [Actinomycetota bacterium]
MLKLGIITDEISQDFDHSLKVIDELGVDYIELQSMWGKEVTELNSKELKKVKDLINKWNKKVCSISPHLFFRVPLRAYNDYKSYWGSYNEHLEQFKNAVRIAKDLGTNLVRVFGFESEIWYGNESEWGNVYDIAIEKFKEPIRIAEKENITIIMETCFLNNFSSASTLRKFIEKTGSQNMRALWDPCNTQFLHEKPYPEGYNIIKDYMVHMHIKDGTVDSPNYGFTFCPPGEGQVGNYKQILKTLEEDNYKGVVSFEAEFLPAGGTREDALRLSFNKVKELLEEI